MFWPENTALNVECLAMQGLRLGITAFLVQRVGEVIHPRQSVGVLQPEAAAPCVERFSFQFLSFGVLAFFLEDNTPSCPLALGCHGAAVPEHVVQCRASAGTTSLRLRRVL